MCVIDGTQYHSSTSIKCDCCLTKTHKKGEINYSHSVLQGAIMHPDKKQVLPVMPEATQNIDGTKKQDCESKAAKRFVEALKKAHPRQGFIIGNDNPYSESLFRTVKYHPRWPSEGFKSLDEAKVMPIFDWDNRQVHQYLQQHNLPYHPLWEKGYVSIGDRHTSQPLTAGMLEQDTRFFGQVRECGIHSELV